MLVYADEVRRAMRKRSPEELSRIAAGNAGDYTPEAQEIAREVLKERLAMPPAAEPELGPAPYIAPAWRERCAAWRRRQLPASIPDPIADLFWLGATSATFSLFPLLRIGRGLPPTSADAMALALAAAGTALAHGIYRERLYPRPLAILFVTALAIAGLPLRRNEEGRREWHPLAIVHAWKTIRYLVRDSEAIEYYARLKQGRRAEVALAGG